MNFDGKTGTKHTSLRGPAQVIASGDFAETEAIEPNGYRHALFVVHCNISGARALNGELQDTADLGEWTAIPGTSFSMSVANGDGVEATRAILVAHDSVQRYVRVYLTTIAGTSVAPTVSVMQFNPAVDLGQNAVNLTVN